MCRVVFEIPLSSPGNSTGCHLFLTQIYKPLHTPISRDFFVIRLACIDTDCVSKRVPLV